MQITVCDACEQAMSGIKLFYIPTDTRKRDPDTEPLELCPQCIGKILATLAQDHLKAALMLGEWLRKVQSRPSHKAMD